MRTQYILCFCLSLFLLGACAAKQNDGLADAEGAPEVHGARTPARITDPAGPIPAPQLPQDIAALGSARLPEPSAHDAGTQGSPGVRYTVECKVRAGRGKQADDEQAEKAEALVAEFTKISQLYLLMDKPPQSVTGLEQRLGEALQEARNILFSHGFYSGRAFGRVEAAQNAENEAVVHVVFITGPQYTVGKTAVLYTLPQNAPQPEENKKNAERRKWRMLPKTLEDVGLEPGTPAQAATVLAAVDKVQERFLNNGYPYAKIAGTRFVADHANHTLEAEVAVDPDEFVRMGEIERTGAESVKQSYIDNQRIWRPGTAWNQARIERYRDNLRQSGLFQSVDIVPGPKHDDGTRTVLTSLTSAPERTVGGALKYHSDFGPGLEGYWEHRNLTGYGDRLRIDVPLWLDMQEVALNYRRPFAFRRDTDFIATGGFTHQDLDAYTMTAAAAAAGFERRFSRVWSGNAKLSVEGGNIKESEQPQRDYFMFGIPLGLVYNNTRNPLDSSKGQRVIFSVTPYTGEYEGSFNVVRSRVEGRSYFPLVGEDRLVLALRGVAGVLTGEDAAKVPPSARFYSGGGGSVRGYEYQSLGPRNDKKDPQGGGSLVEVSAETRWKFTPEWGVVAFVDGGMVYEDVFDGVENDLRWGAGIGIRYYTAIGPVRFDVATPLNPRSDDDPLQFYISIGQSF